MSELKPTVADLDRTRLRTARGKGVNLLDRPRKTKKDDGQWTMAAKNHASTRFSALNEINTTNVGRMKAAWTFSTGVTAGHEAAPLA